LRRNPRLDQAARSFAAYLARSGKFSHTADGRQPADRIKAAGYRYCQVAENLALNVDTRGFRTPQLAETVVTGWKNSPGHRRNMLMKSMTEIGVAVVRATPEHRYLSVQLFGRPDSLKFKFQVRNNSRVNVTYTSFNRDGTPLRAELDTRFISDAEAGKRLAEENKKSADLTHSRVVKSGDTLPLLTQAVYGSSAYYVRVAQVNQLDDFRNLTPGQKIFFPPLEQ